MRFLRITALILLTTSCQTRTVKHSGLNDLVFGSQQVILYDNGEFRLELGAGGTEGIYETSNDTIYLEYFDKPKNWPDQLVLTEEYFIAIPNDRHLQPIRIRRSTEENRE